MGAGVVRVAGAVVVVGIAGGCTLAASIQTALEQEIGDPGRAVSQAGLISYVSGIAFTYFAGRQYSQTAPRWLRQTSWWSSRVVALLLLVAAPLACLLAFTVPKPGSGYQAAAVIAAGIGTVAQIATVWWLARNWNK